ncbi:DUF1376 domain-containing protein [Bradyrhizobium sp. CB82]|uniref:DUF1376 domain-containing protein n=1 Tax=Bradyrhizobium sp. CB82 TaxID=3039159 RepID=UPI0024B23C96|nr:DUF1376 domain-containing protein [Bradyrhizobium sp. CB82]WFU42571.1 DUF1376 domain-containing protein [Bradyrhizobium sp. CB82]
MDGTEGLDDGPYRVYHVVCQLIYLHEGPIALHEQGLAGRCNQHILTFRRNLKALLDAGKLRIIDGRLTNDRAETELQLVQDRRSTSAKGGRGSRGVRKGSGRGQGEVEQRSSGDVPDKALNSNGSVSSPLSEQQHHKSRGEESRGEKSREEKKDAAPYGARSGSLDLGEPEPPRSKPPPSDPEAELFRRGREILGDKAGGMISQLLKAKDRNVALARAAIEQASTKENPREFIGRIIRGNEPTTVVQP